MKFIERVKIAKEYAEWLKSGNEKYNFTMPFNPETFLAFLEIKGYSVEKQTNMAEWIIGFYEVKCSNCGYLVWGSELNTYKEWKFCPNCGYRMEDRSDD